MKIRGALFQAWIPLAYGRFAIFCAVGTPDAPDIPPGIGGEINALDHVEKLADGLRASLTRAECDEILGVFLKAWHAYYAVNPFLPLPLVRSALADHRGAVDWLIAFPPHPGLSRWASLQAVEKLLKALLALRGQKYPTWGHDLSALVGLAQVSGLQAIPSGLINTVQCRPGVRYGEIPETVDSAVAAHHAALDLTITIGEALAVGQSR